MKITQKFLNKIEPCNEGLKWAIAHNLIGKERVIFLKELIKDDKLDWANWLIVRTMSYKQDVAYAIYAAEQVIAVFEKQYPEDKRPKIAIEAAKECLKNPNKKNKAAAAAAYVAAADAAAAYADAAAAAYAAAYAAKTANAAYANAAYVAAYAAAYVAAYADAAAAYAADAAKTANANAANANAANAKNEMQLRILDFGIKLIG
jgi:hypothetical protein